MYNPHRITDEQIAREAEEFGPRRFVDVHRRMQRVAAHPNADWAPIWEIRIYNRTQINSATGKQSPIGASYGEYTNHDLAVEDATKLANAVGARLIETE